MIKILIPEIKGKVKTSARGFWRNEAGRTYYDYLKVGNLDKNYNCKALNKRFYLFLEGIKTAYNQEALFFISNNKGYCFYDKFKIEVLPNRIYKEVLRVNLKTEIKEALRQYSGCTIYIEAGRYYIEIFYK